MLKFNNGFLPIHYKIAMGGGGGLKKESGNNHKMLSEIISIIKYSLLNIQLI